MVEKLESWKDTLEKNRYAILYGAAMFTLFCALAGWALLPDQVTLVAEGELVAKNTALLANIGVTAIFSLFFWRKPRELVYFVALCLGLLVSVTPLLKLIGG